MCWKCWDWIVSHFLLSSFFWRRNVCRRVFSLIIQQFIRTIKQKSHFRSRNKIFFANVIINSCKVMTQIKHTNVLMETYKSHDSHLKNSLHLERNILREKYLIKLLAWIFASANCHLHCKFILSVCCLNLFLFCIDLLIPTEADSICLSLGKAQMHLSLHWSITYLDKICHDSWHRSDWANHFPMTILPA